MIERDAAHGKRVLAAQAAASSPEQALSVALSHLPPSPWAGAALPALFSRSASQRDCAWQRLAGEACKGYTLAPRWLEAQRVPRSAEKSGTSGTSGSKNDAPNSWSLIVHRSVPVAPKF